MYDEAVMLAVSCVLFVQTGLSEAVQHTLRFRFRPLSCPKCLTFWSALAWLLLRRAHPIPALAASFVLADLALWASLLLDGLAVLYNWFYEQVNPKTTGASEGAEDDNSAPGEAPSDEVPQM